jgi:hypothetical protein
MTVHEVIIVHCITMGLTDFCDKGTHFRIQLPEQESEYNAKVCNKWRFNTLIFYTP